MVREDALCSAAPLSFSRGVVSVYFKIRQFQLQRSPRSTLCLRLPDFHGDLASLFNRSPYATSETLRPHISYRVRRQKKPMSGLQPPQDSKSLVSFIADLTIIKLTTGLAFLRTLVGTTL